MPALHIAFHLIELLADTLEPSHLPASHVSLPGFTQPLDALPVARIEVETVGELRKVAAWPDNLVITTPQKRYPESAIKVSKVSVATRVSPKP